MTSVDVAVIGRGMIGSAAARHLAERGVATALIGPDEPADRATDDGPFSSHADQGRITRIAGRTIVWSELAARSVARYADIQARSGINFHTPSGLVIAVPDVDDWLDFGLIMGANVRKVETDWVRDTTGIELPVGMPAVYEGPPAGHINPRRLVEAQTALVERTDAVVIREAATSIDRAGDGFDVSGPWGSITVGRVLLATGAFGRELFDGDLDLERRPRTMLFAETEHTGPWPSLITHQPADKRLEAVYWVPPVRFPDGKVCLKIGGNMFEADVLDTDQDLVDWFHGDGDPTEIEALETALRSLLPDVKWASMSSSPCVVTATPTGYPYLGWVEEGLAVAIGGNGSAAKSSDELGRLAATLFDEEGWTDSIDAALFTPEFR